MARFIVVIFIVFGLFLNGCSKTDISTPVELEQTAITNKQQEKEAIKEINKIIEQELEESDETDEEIPEDLEIESNRN